MGRHDRYKKREKECVTAAMIFTSDHGDDRGDECAHLEEGTKSRATPVARPCILG